MPHTQWPSQVQQGTVLLWALVPDTDEITTRALEAQWRSRMLQGNRSMTVHILYGEARQQAQQLAPWLPQPQAQNLSDASNAHCWECLDGRSEQALFQHLLEQATVR